MWGSFSGEQDEGLPPVGQAEALQESRPPKSTPPTPTSIIVRKISTRLSVHSCYATGPRGHTNEGSWAAASGRLPTSPSSSSFSLARSSAWLPRKVLWGFGWGEHVCTHAPLMAGAHRLSQAFPALHLSGSTWCGINAVDCCPGEVRGGGKGHSLQRPLFVLPPVREPGPAQLSHTPPGKAQNSLITHPLPLCPQGRMPTQPLALVSIQ